jgi:hypothetical protein
MIRLQDGTVVNLSDAGHKFLTARLPELMAGGHEVLTVTHHRSKSTGNLANISMRLEYNYEDMVKWAIQVVKGRDPEKMYEEHKGVFPPECDVKLWKKAREEVLASLAESIGGLHSRDVSSRSGRKLSKSVPGVYVGLSTGDVQLRGVIEDYELLERGDKKKKVKSRPLTLAKREYERGTYREGGKRGSFITVSLRKGMFESLTIAEEYLLDQDFALESSTSPVASKVDKIDAIFVIDTTGSNRHNQPSIRDALGGMIKLLEGVDVRVGFVFQGDYCDGDKLVTTYPPRELFEAHDILKKNHDTHGGDGPEAYEVGLHEARQMRVRPGAVRVIVMVTDSIPHGYALSSSDVSLREKKKRGLDFVDELRKAAASDFRVHFLYTASGSSMLPRQWSRQMSTLNAGSEFLELEKRKNLPYILAGVVCAEVGQLSNYEKNARKMGVYTSEVESALRVFYKRGSSERVLVTSDSGEPWNVVWKHRCEGEEATVKELRHREGVKEGKSFVELTKSARLKSPVKVASVGDGDTAFVRTLESPEGWVRLGPDAHGCVYVEVRSEGAKRVNDGQSMVLLAGQV